MLKLKRSRPQKYEGFLKKGIFRIICIGIFLFCIQIGSAQTIPPAELLVKDTINFGDGSRNGLINKIIQPFRFRENIQKKERDRIMALIRRLTAKGDLVIDSATVESITDELVSLTNQLMMANDTTERLKIEIARTIENLDSKAPQSLVDSIQIQLGNVLQGLLDQSNASQVTERAKISNAMIQLRQIALSCNVPGPESTNTLGDTLIVNYRFCLKPRLSVFGWHSSSRNADFQGYNLNYLTDLILKGYQLGIDGIESNKEGLRNTLDSMVLTKSKAFGLRISLSVFTSSVDRTQLLLTKEEVQSRFFNRISALIKTYGLNGVNLDLNGLDPKDSGKFMDFVSRLKSNLLAKDSSLILSVNLPPLANRSETDLISSLDFNRLNQDVDYYFIQTHQLNITATRIPFALSPLWADETFLRGSIENAFSFLSNKGALMEKLVMTVSYEGIHWPMPDYIPGSRAIGFGTKVDYSQSQDILIRAMEEDGGAILGYDPIQASAYLNFRENGILRQMWYADPRGLAAKYDWAVRNSLGGVAIQGLGTDSGSSMLWDALGASLIKVDSIGKSQRVIKAVEPKKKLSFWDYLTTYSVDIQFAGLNDIYIGDPNRKPKEWYCYFDPFPSRDTIRLMADQLCIEDYWDYRSEFETFPNTDYYFINSTEECYCMIGRWDIYAEINGIAFVISFGLLIISVIITFIGIKRNGEDWEWKSAFLLASIIFGLLSFITLFFHLFFDTQFKYIGAGSDEVTIWGVMVIFAIGILAGVIIHRLRISKTFTQRDLP